MRKKEKPESQGKQVADMIDYQEGSIVSRTLIDKEAGSMTLFAFDQGQGLGEHTTPYDAMVYMLAGEAKITVSGEAIVVKQGEMTIMPANHPHAVAAVTRFKMLLTMIRS